MPGLGSMLSACTCAGLALFRPALFVWPWVLATAALALFLDSSQARALSATFSEQPPAAPVVVYVVLATSGLVGAGALLAMLASAPRLYGDVDLRLQVAFTGVWVAVLSVAFVAVFAAATRSTAAWYAAAAFALIELASFAALAAFVHAAHADARRFIGFFYRYRLAFAAAVAALMVIGMAFVATTATYRPLIFGHIGPLLTATLGLAVVGTFFGTWLITIPQSLGIPWAGLLAMVVLAALTAARSPHPASQRPQNTHRELSDALLAQESCQPTPASLRAAVQEHLNLPPLPGNNHHTVFFVSAEGGGIRAAYWTALALGQMDVATKDLFGRRVATASGVSGGSLGIATWLAARERQDLPPEARHALMKEFLGGDFLSPLLAGLLFLDLPRSALGPLWFRTERGQVFERAIADHWRRVGGTDFFDRHFFSLCLKGFDKPPAVYFNATDALTGDYVPLSTAAFPEGPDAAPHVLKLDVARTTFEGASVAKAVHASAAFPYLSSPVDVGVPYDSAQPPARGFVPHMAALVDGGYHDNTGLLPTMHALEEITSHRSKGTAPQKIKVQLIHIENDPGPACDWVSKKD